MIEINEQQSKFDPYSMWKELKDKYHGDPDLADSWEAVEQALKTSMGNFGHTTCGNFSDEKDAAAFFDSKINNKFFHIEKEVVGRRLFDDKPKQKSDDGEDEEQGVRIDRLLIPNQSAYDAGWKYGPIAVEIKRSNMAIGPSYAQVFEYRQSLFISKYLYNSRIMPLVFAVFPMTEVKYDLHSLSMTQIILSCRYNRYNNSLKFGYSSLTALEITDKEITVNDKFRLTTRKGSRGKQK